MIHVFNEDRSWEVWSDTEVTERDGRCIGSGKTRSEAIADAFEELQNELEALRQFGREEFLNPTKQCESQPAKNP